MSKSRLSGLIMLFEGLLLSWQGFGMTQRASWCIRLSLGFSNPVVHSLGFIVASWSLLLGIAYFVYGIAYLILSRKATTDTNKPPELFYMIVGALAVVLTLL